ncbi:amino acid adenylation domain-containing protein [Paenibacillus phyllosphaerae]|uniref:Amino acid adenylation domain-containing protein n=1 Tax=Paenibacillus phyllosphaerae TaxID=274593 RepID=A0A7W5B1Q7_9BACL|nr:non-ribosomal peptide synthetase [Paenibacillus phyllosphaerae]MBB3112261.1 amino acid adenylation domain-containing protein [Paenibacillus phyllosphaerae]
MQANNFISALEMDQAAVTQVFVRRLTHASVIGTIDSILRGVNGDEALRDVMHAWVERTASKEQHEEFVRRESARSIGCTGRMRVILAVASEDEADLIIVANRERATFQDLLQLSDYLSERRPDFAVSDAAKPKYGSYIRPKWGVPNWSSKAGYSQSYRAQLPVPEGVFDSARVSSAIAYALLLTLDRYGSKNGKIRIEANDQAARTIRTGWLDDNKQLQFKDEGIHADGAHSAIDAGIIISDLANPNDAYTPCLTALYPVTVSVTTYNGTLHALDVAASEKMVQPAVLQQFAQLIQFYLQAQAERSDLSPHQWLNLPLPSQAAVSHTPSKKGRIGQPDNLALLARLEAVAAAYPGKTAVSGEDGSITYAEFKLKSDTIAKKLIASGLHPGDKVIVSLDQTVELVLIMAAIVKAGGTYIPVDPNYPQERITFVMEDSQATHIITRSKELSALDALRRIAPELLIEEEPDKLDSVVLPNIVADVAYMIYTSGTTGQPKGVMVPPRNIMSLIEATEQEFRLTHRDVWTMFHSASFDFSVWEMWGSLLTGGHLVVVPRQTARSPYDFYELLAEKQVTVLNQTPSAFYALTKVDHEQRQAKLTSIRLVIFGGEALDTYKLSNWLERYPVSCCRLVNMYGITETTVHVTYRNIRHRDPEFLAKSVGVALPGWEISIRDERGEPSFYGMEGEIWVGGAGLSHGYHNREELTSQRFVIDPKDGRRWYRSGDLGRMRPDASVDYLGRMDSQVKLRGFRIELDEIRAVIQKLPNIRNVAVMLHDGQDGESSHKQIVAFIESADRLHGDSVRGELKNKMPEYMIPARIVRVGEIPMTINGKVDYGALTLKLNEPQQEERASDTGNSADGYLSLWSKVLGHAIGPDDNFFESGGNSLLAVELLSALKKEVDSALTLRDLYIHSSPNALQQFVSSKSIR